MEIDVDIAVFFSSDAYPLAVFFGFQHSTCLRLGLKFAATLVIIAHAATVVGGQFSLILMTCMASLSN